VTVHRTHERAPRRLIGLTGRPGSGKDSCAQALAAHGFQAIAFADALRQEVAAAWRVDLRMLTDRATKETALPALAIGRCGERCFVEWAVFHGHSLHEPRSPRWVLQRWGTEFRRGQTPDYWVRQVEGWVAQRPGPSAAGVVITDVRMPNEAALVRQLGGHLLRVHRPDLPPMPPDTAGHDSEAHAALQVDGVIHNDGSLAALGEEMQLVLAGLFGAEVRQ
jgi:hypothetical protein